MRASNAPYQHESTMLDNYPVTENDRVATFSVAEAFHAQIGHRAYEAVPVSASEEFSIFGRNGKVP